MLKFPWLGYHHILIILFTVFISTSAKAQFNTYGNAFRNDPTSSCYTLTPDLQTQKGAIWLDDTLDLRYDQLFTFDINLGTKEDGADGMALVLARSTNIRVGRGGFEMGYASIEPSIVLEFDTYNNSETPAIAPCTFCTDDPDFDHMALVKNGIPRHQDPSNLAGPVSILPGGANAENGQYYRITFHWDRSRNIVEVFVDCQLRLSYSGDILNDNFKGDPTAFLAITAATAASNNRHQACPVNLFSWKAPSDTLMCPGDTLVYQAGRDLDFQSGINVSWAPQAGIINNDPLNPVFAPDTTTTYIASYTDACGTIREDTFTIEVPVLEVSAGPDTAICVGEDVILLGSGNESLQWTPSGSLNNPNIATPRATPSSNTDYILTVTEPNGCQLSDTVTVTVNPLPNADAGNDTSICIGDSVVLQASGGESYNWALNSTLSQTDIANPIAKPTRTSLYLVTVTDTNACSRSDFVRIIVNKLPIAEAGADQTICEGDSVLLRASGGSVYQWSPGDGLSTPDQDETFASPLSSTTYFVAVTDNNQCSAEDSVSVEVSPPPSIDAGNDTSVCEGSSIRLIASGGIQYEWPNVSGINPQDVSNPEVSPVVDTRFRVIVTGSNGCKAEDSVLVVVNPLPNADAGNDTSICFLETFRLSANGGISYLWAGDNIVGSTEIADPEVFAAKPGIYTVTVTDSLGCEQTDQMNLSILSLPLADAGQDQAVCFGDTVQLSASGGDSYLWNAPVQDSTIANSRVVVTENTTFTVTVFSNEGCSRQDSVRILVNPLPTADAGEYAPLCEGDTIQLEASGGISYRWFPSESLSDSSILDPLAFPASNTTYYVEVTDENNCRQTDSASIQVNPLPLVSAGEDQSICFGDSIQLNANGAQVYIWSPSGGLSETDISDPLAFPLLSQTYQLLGIDSLGCQNTDTIRVDVRSLPFIDAGDSTELCLGDSIQLNAGGGDNYLWENTGTINNPLIANPLIAPQNSAYFFVSTQDNTGCIGRDSVWVEVLPLPVVMAGPDASICFGDSTQLSATGAGSYRWFPEQGLSNTGISLPIGSPIVDQVYYVEGTDSKGCVNTDSTSILVLALPAVDAGNDTLICSGDAINLNAQGTGSFRWISPSGIPNSGLQQVTVQPDITTQYVVMLTDSNACEQTDSVMVSLRALPEVSILADTVICEGEFSILEANGALSYRWAVDSTLSDLSSPNPLAMPLTSTSYTVTGFDELGCNSNASIAINVQAKPEISGEDQYFICQFDRATLTVSGADQYIWSTGQQGESIEVSPLASTQYWAIPVQGTCLGDTLEIDLTVFDNFPIPNFAPDITEAYVGTQIFFENQSTEASSYVWNFGDGDSSTLADPNHIYNDPGEYTVILTAINDEGCKDSITFEFINIYRSNIWVPSAFSPNGDGINDVFSVKAEAAEEIEIKIFNRWGSLVFESDRPDDAWNGTYNGSLLPEGVYIFLISMKDPLGRVMEEKGTVTLFR